MAEDSHYASDTSANKRKYEDTQMIPSRRPTGFSAPISSSLSPSDTSPVGQQPPSYNAAPPPMDEIQLAKQKAQEIAARLFNNAAESIKRPRSESGDYENEGYFQKPVTPSVLPPAAGSYGFSGGSKKIEIPNARVGVIIGKGGETIKYLQVQSGAKIQVTRDMDSDPNSYTRDVELMGTADQIAKAEQLINDVLAEAESGGSGTVNRRVTGQQSGAEQFVMKVANNKVGLVIGKGGETIKNMQARSGARIQVIPLHLPPGDTSTERTVQIDGTSEQIETAKQLIYEVTAENRQRNQSMSGGYSQQGYQARPQASWAPPPGAPMQQPGYGYLPPGAYPGSAPQYNSNQPSYAGYPPQPTSGGYAAGWDQTTAPSQQSAQGGGYDYYSQQAPPHQQQQQPAGGQGAPSDGSAYAYSQPPASGYSQGQGYQHDGYGGYSAPAPQSGYGANPPSSVPGYDQQQNYYASGGYANPSNPPSESHAPSNGTQGENSQVTPAHSSAGQQSYAANQQPSPNPGYPPQGPGFGLPQAAQGGYGSQPPAGYSQSYGTPQVQKPPSNQLAYGQPQQSPTSAQGGYGQTGYPPQSGYAQPDSAAQRPPSTGYGPPSAQPGYGAPSYGAPPAGQSYAAYNAAYGGGYAQPPAYSASDASSGGNAQGAYDSTPATQAAPPSGAAKASPPS